MQVTVTFDYPDGLIHRYGEADAAATVAGALAALSAHGGAEPLNISALQVQTGASSWSTDPISGVQSLAADPPWLVVAFEVDGLSAAEVEAVRVAAAAAGAADPTKKKGRAALPVWSSSPRIPPHGVTRA